MTHLLDEAPPFTIGTDFDRVARLTIASEHAVPSWLGEGLAPACAGLTRLPLDGWKRVDVWDQLALVAVLDDLECDDASLTKIEQAMMIGERTATAIAFGAARGLVEALCGTHVPARLAELRDHPGARWVTLVSQPVFDGDVRYAGPLALAAAALSSATRDRCVLNIVGLETGGALDAQLSVRDPKPSWEAWLQQAEAGLSGLLRRPIGNQPVWARAARIRVSRCCFDGAMITYGNLGSSVLQHCAGRGAYFRSTQLVESRFEACAFTECYLQRAKLRQAHIERCNFDRSSFFEATLTNSRFHCSSFVGVSFRDASVKDCVFDHCDFRGAKPDPRTLPGDSTFDGCLFDDVPRQPSERKQRVLLPAAAANAQEGPWELPFKILYLDDFSAPADPRPLDERRPIAFDKTHRTPGKPALLDAGTPLADALWAFAESLPPSPSVVGLDVLQASKRELHQSFDDAPELAKTALFRLLTAGEPGGAGGPLGPRWCSAMPSTRKATSRCSNASLRSQPAPGSGHCSAGNSPYRHPSGSGYASTRRGRRPGSGGARARHGALSSMALGEQTAASKRTFGSRPASPIACTCCTARWSPQPTRARPRSTRGSEGSPARSTTSVPCADPAFGYRARRRASCTASRWSYTHRPSAQPATSATAVVSSPGKRYKGLARFGAIAVGGKTRPSTFAPTAAKSIKELDIVDCMVHNYSVGRIREFDEIEAIDRAMGVFWRLGFDATSLPDLLKATELSRSSLYLTFGSKEELFERCVTLYADRMMLELRSQLEASRSPRAFLRALFFAASDGTDRRGCLVMNTANELGQREPKFGKIISLQIARFEGIFFDALVRAVDAGELSKEADVRAIARYLVCSLSGLRTMAKAGLSRAALRSAAEIVLKSFS